MAAAAASRLKLGPIALLLLLVQQAAVIQAFLLVLPSQPPQSPPLLGAVTSRPRLRPVSPPPPPLPSTLLPPALRVRAAAAAAAGNDGEDMEEMEEAACPCSDMGSGTDMGQAGPLTELCDLGDVVVLVLPEADEEGRNLALAVVDGDDEATLLCLRDADFIEWFRDYREAPRRGLRASAVLRVVGTAAYSQRNIPSLGGGVGYGAEAEDCWFIADSDLAAAGLDDRARDGLRRPIDNVGTAPWMFLG